MKKYLLIISVFLISITSKSQNYTPIDFENGQWYCNYSSKGGIHGQFGNRYVREDIKMYFNGDTLLNDTVYHILYYEGYAIGADQMNPPKTAISGYFSFVRDDTMKKQIYGTNKFGKVVLIHDFNLKLGDSLYAGDNEPKAPITLIDSVNYCGTYRKTYHYKNSRNYPLKLIEGIGATAGLIPTYGASVGSSSLCYSEKNKGCDTCGLKASVNKINQASIKLYPNPSDGLIYIESEFPILYIKITNILGKIILEENVNFLLKTEINIEESGVYILQIKTSEGISTTKFIKK